MADQDHGLDEVRELARGLRENEEHGPDDGLSGAAEREGKAEQAAAEYQHAGGPAEPDDGESEQK